MKLYNINFICNADPVLIPRVPESAGPGENDTIKRICLADSVLNCVQAIGPSSRDMFEGSVFIVKSVDTNSLDSTKLIPPRTLWLNDWVPDALENHEYWYLDTLHMEVQGAQVISYDYEYQYAWTCAEPADIRAIGDKFGIAIPVGLSSYKSYDYAMNYLMQRKEHDAMDKFDSMVTGLPWIQKIAFTEFKITDYDINKIIGS